MLSGQQTQSQGIPALGVLEPPVWVSSLPEGSTQRPRSSEECSARGGRWGREPNWLSFSVSQVTSLKCYFIKLF